MMKNKLDPQAAQWLHEIALKGGPSITEFPAQEARAMMYLGNLEKPVIREEVSQIQNLKIPTKHKDIPLRVYQATPDALSPILLYFHGGGWVGGNLDTHDPLCRALANATGFVIASVDYSLSPEAKFPLALQEGYDVLQWLGNNAQRIAGKADWIATGGDSAGGNLATSLALLAKREGNSLLKYQVLSYPVTDVSSFNTASYQEFTEGYGLTSTEMQWFAEQYLADPKDGMNPLVSPLLADDLAGLPPAFFTIAEYDVLQAEGDAYAEKLKEAGVQVVVKSYPGMTHGFLGMIGIFDRTRTALDDIAFALRSAYQKSDASKEA